MSKNLDVKVSQRKGAWEATVSIQGTRPTKLVQSNGSSTFGTRAAALTSARSLAKRLGFNGISDQAVTAKAAKKSIKTPSKKATPTPSTCQTTQN